MTDNNGWPGKPGVPKDAEQINLVARLRNTPNWLREEYGHYKDGLKVFDRAPFEAADALEFQSATIVSLRAQLATARKDALEEAARRLEELHKNHNYDPDSGTLTKKLGRYDKWPESAKTAKLEHDTGYYRAIAEGVAHIRALAKGEGDE